LFGPPFHVHRGEALRHTGEISYEVAHQSTGRVCPSVLKSRAAWALLALFALSIPSLLLGCVPASRSASAQGERFAGQWLVEYKPGSEKVQLTLSFREERTDAKGGRHSNNWNTTNDIETDKLQGLTREQAFSTSGQNVRFQIRREAGTFNCEGWFKDGKGSGHFTFAPDAAFAAALRQRGVGSPDERQLFSLAQADVGLALLDELKSQGYELPSIEQLVRLGHHGVRLDYLKGLSSLGYRLGTIDSLVRMRDHGVGLDFIRQLREFGYRNLTAEELVRARDHGVSVVYIEELRAAGYATPPLEGLIRIRDHGVSTTFIRELRAEGFDSLPLEQLVRLKDHGVTVNFIKELKVLGYPQLSVEQLVRLRDHGVNAAFVRRAKSSMGDNPTVDELIQMKNRGTFE